MAVEVSAEGVVVEEGLKLGQFASPLIEEGMLGEIIVS